jgi:small conductance mechanosensitive channel
MAKPRSRLPHPTRHWLIALLAAVALFVSAQAGFAQGMPPKLPGTAAPAAKPDTAADLDSLIKTLDDPAARDKLKQQLQSLLQAQRGEANPTSGAAGGHHAEQGFGAKMLAVVSHHVNAVSDTLVNVVEVIADVPQHAQEAAVILSDPARRAYWTEIVLDVFGVLATAFIAARATRRLMVRPRHALRARATERWLVRLFYLPVIFVVEALSTLAFVVASSVAVTVFRPNDFATDITLAIIGAQIATMLTASTAASLLAVSAPRLRLFPMSDETAAYLQVWVRRLSVVAFYGYAITELSTRLGIDASLYEVIARLWGLLLAAMAIILILQNRASVAQWIAGGPAPDQADPPPTDEPVATPLEPEAPPANHRALRFKAFRRQAARVWHILAIAYVVAGYAVWSLQIEGGFAFLLRATVLTAILFGVVRLADTFLRQVFDRSFALPDEVKRVLPGLETRANRYLPLMKQALLVVLYFAGLFALLQIWGLDMIGWLSDGSGRPVMAAIFKIVIILALAALLSEVVNLGIEHYLRDHDQHGRRIYHSSRMRTLLPLLRNAFRITLGVMVLLVVLSEVGIDIAPLLAAAGVVGLAIGFGAQTLVKDIITGVFILLEDTIAIGDVVDLGGHAGVVEGMTIRTIRLRDGAGTVHTVPFSAVTIVQNLTKDFSYATFDLKVDLREDVDRVIETMKEVGAVIEKDRDFRYGLLGPMEIIGVDSFQDNGIIIKARMKTRAMSQWDVMRAFNIRLKRKFDERGMLFAGLMAAMPAMAPTKHEVTVNAPPAGGKPAEPPHPETAAEAQAETAEGKISANGDPPAAASRSRASPT